LLTGRGKSKRKRKKKTFKIAHQTSRYYLQSIISVHIILTSTPSPEEKEILNMKIQAIIFTSFVLNHSVQSFQCMPISTIARRHHHASKDIITLQQTSDENNSVSNQKGKKRAAVMALLRKSGAVGRNQDFSTAMGVDEGPVGKNKSQGAFPVFSLERYVLCIQYTIILEY
jgi:glutamyl/glutaminyl-tRNA synthetase